MELHHCFVLDERREEWQEQELAGVIGGCMHCNQYKKYRNDGDGYIR
jgi:hypothetical protein